MSAFFRGPAFLTAASVIVFGVGIFVALFPFAPAGVHLKEGEIASRTIRAPRDISFESPLVTQRRQEEAAAAVRDSLVFDPSVPPTQQTELSILLSRVRAVVSDTAASPSARASALEAIAKLDLSPASLAVLSTLAPAEFDAVESEARRALAAVYAQSLPAEAVSATRDRAVSFVGPGLSAEQAALVADIIRPFIVSNLTIDKAATDAARAAARAGVAPVRVSFLKGQIIVERDAKITPEAHEALVEAGLIGSPWRPQLIGAVGLVSFFFALAVAAGLHAFRGAVRPRDLLVIGLALVFPVFIMKAYLPLILPDEDRHFLTYIMPVAASSMVLAGFVGAELALLAASFVALLAAFAAVILVDVSVVSIAGALDVARLALVSGLAGAAGVFAVRQAERLAQFLIGGLLVGLSVFAVLAATWLIDPSRELRDLPWLSLAAFANGGLSAFLSVGIFVTLGSLFGVTTRVQLMEMSQLSQPLLLRLQEEAPATFQHSVIVASLGEKGAHVIGADALLTRVGCYFHDIGKLIRPGFFIENQLGGENPHDALHPADSARIIADHVRDGIALARRFKLPPKVISFIPEHHGTRLVSYFYRRAVEQGEEADAAEFRYPGPIPQSRETAIAMLADSCEAAVRSSPDRSAERIDAMVDEVFSERLAEGQLDECDLTLRDLRALSESFKSTLRAVYHPRIEYPAPVPAEVRMRRLPFRWARGG